MMKPETGRNLLVGVFCFFALSAIGQANPDEVLGVWETEDKDGRIEIFRDEDRYSSKLLWGKDIVEEDGVTSKKDKKNPDESLRSRDLVGIVNMTGLRYEDEEYVDGKIYDASSGKIYKCYLWMDDGNLHMRGYLGVPLLGQTVIWKRVK